MFWIVISLIMANTITAKEAGDFVTFRNLRNQVNRLALKLKPTLHQKKISHLKHENNRHWWKDMKNLIDLGSNDNYPLQNMMEIWISFLRALMCSSSQLVTL